VQCNICNLHCSSVKFIPDPTAAAFNANTGSAIQFNRFIHRRHTQALIYLGWEAYKGHLLRRAIAIAHPHCPTLFGPNTLSQQPGIDGCFNKKLDRQKKKLKLKLASVRAN
jgi:hypothetical protein